MATWTRLMARVSPEPNSGCWLWTGATAGAGYGGLAVAGRWVYGHRVAWELANGAIPAGLHVLHRCDQPSCVNPAHLFLGTHAENMADREAKGRGRRPRTKGEAHWGARLTEATVREMRERHERGESSASLGRAFGVTQSAAWHAVTGRTWSHVP